MTLVATVLLTWLLSATEPVTGEVTFYAPPKHPGESSLMKKVWNWRVWKGHVPECPECVDAIAVVDPEHIGHKAWIRHPNGEIVGPLMVVDCAEAKHRPNLRKRGWIADISWELAHKWKMAGPLEGVTIYFEPPPGGAGRAPAAAASPPRPARAPAQAAAPPAPVPLPAQAALPPHVVPPPKQNARPPSQNAALPAQPARSRGAELVTGAATGGR